MRSFSSSWSTTLRKLGFTRARRTRRATLGLSFESLESRIVFSTEHIATHFLPGNCGVGGSCECGNASNTSDNSPTTSASAGGLPLTYNGASQAHPILTFNAPIRTEEWLTFNYPGYDAEDVYVHIAPVDGSIDFADTYYDVPEAGQRKTVSFVGQANSSGRHYWLGEIAYKEGGTGTVIHEDHFFAFQDVVNRDTSQFGAGFSLPELDRLVVDQWFYTQEYGYNFEQWGVSLVTGDNQAVWFSESLVQDKSGFTLYDNYDENPYSFANLERDHGDPEDESDDVYILAISTSTVYCCNATTDSATSFDRITMLTDYSIRSRMSPGELPSL
jgi:hypothetical protein